MRQLVVALLLASAPAAAHASAASAFAAGDFASAATAGRAEQTAPSLVLAGRATALEAAFKTTDKARARTLLAQAVADFDAALKKDPASFDAIVQRGIAIGYQAKLERAPGLAKQARKSFETALAKRPGDAVALGAMGGWHGEAVATLGKFLAGTALGAKEGESLKFYDKALAAPGADPAIPVFYASTLLGLSADNAPKARTLLERAVKARPVDGFDKLMQANARAILAPLAKGDVPGARRTAARLAPLGTVG
jgi:tetratricopeptide (TPR) repeat protein